MNDPELGSPSEWNSIDNDNKAPEEVSMFCQQDKEPEFLEKLLVTTSEEGKIATKINGNLNNLTNSSELMTHANQTNSLSSNDEIKRNICHPDTSFRSDGNELYISKNTTFEAQAIVQSVVDTVVKQSLSIGTNPVEALCTHWDEQNSDDPSPHLPDQIAQQMPSVRLSPSLQFVHDVDPCQKTGHNTDHSNKCSDKDLAPYVMRIQGIKTDADKGKSILPRLKVSVLIQNSE